MDSLKDILVFLAAAVLVVPVFRKLGLGTVLGYIASGVLIGPWGLGLIDEVDRILHTAELGVVLLLFVIGLELQPNRLWLMRRPMLLLGGSQVLVSAALIAGAAAPLLGRWNEALILGLSLALSSTAFAVRLLAEREALLTHHGRAAFAVLLFQDLIVIPILALLPLLGGDGAAPTWRDGAVEALRAVGVIALFAAAGHWVVRPVLRWVASAHNPELFSAASLLVALGTAALMHAAGLSMALGAFLVGVLLADSEFRHELEANIEPFKGLLLGLFFTAVGMSMNLGLLAESPLRIVALALGLLALKAAALYPLARLNGHGPAPALRLAALLAQGGEFAFVILYEAERLSLVSGALIEPVILAVTLSMAATPLVVALAERLAGRLERNAAPPPSYDPIEDDKPRVIIIGFGRFGQIVARILSMKRIRFTALESNLKQVEVVRRYGHKVYFGDATRLETLRAAGLGDCEVVILSIVNPEVSVKVAEMIKKHFPRVKVFARARNRAHAYRLLDAGVDYVIRETFLSAVELARNVLRDLGLGPEEAEAMARAFVEHDEALLKRQWAVAHDEAQLIASAKAAAQELQSLFEEDAGTRLKDAAPERGPDGRGA